MSLPVSLFIGLRYTLTRRRNRSVSFISAIAMVGIILGVALLITVLSVMNGFEKELKERILTIMPQVTIYQSGGMQDWSSWRDQLLDQEQVVGAAPFVELRVMLHEGRFTKPALVYGVSNQFESSVSNITEYLDDKTLEKLNQENNAIALGVGLAESLQVNRGDSLLVIVARPNRATQAPVINRFDVIDIFNTGTELDQSLSLMGLSFASQLNSESEKSGVTGLHLKVNELFDAPRISSELRSQLPFDFYTSDWTRTHGNIYHAIKMSKSLVGILLFLIIAIAAFNVVSTLVMVVVDKQSDIAILRTLGLSNAQVMAVFMVQGSLIGFIGTAIGIICGLLFALSVQDIVSAIESLFNVTFLKSDIYPISFLPSSIALADVILVASVSLIMSLIATIYPAYRAVRVQPAQALRYD